MAIPYLILTSPTAAGLQDLVTGSLASGYTLLGGPFSSGSAFVQAMMLQSVTTDNYKVNPERLSRAFRLMHTESAYYSTASKYQ
jgi:hypothetical protein